MSKKRRTGTTLLRKKRRISVLLHAKIRRNTSYTWYDWRSMRWRLNAGLCKSSSPGRPTPCAGRCCSMGRARSEKRMRFVLLPRATTTASLRSTLLRRRAPGQSLTVTLTPRQSSWASPLTREPRWCRVKPSSFLMRFRLVRARELQSSFLLTMAASTTLSRALCWALHVSTLNRCLWDMRKKFACSR